MDSVLERTTTVREATLADIPQIVAMGMRFAGAEYAEFLRPTPEALAQLAKSFIESPAMAALVSESRSGMLTGMMGLSTYLQPMSQERIATEVVWWMEPEARGSRDAMRLFRAGETWARAQGATRLQMIAPTDHVGQFYERLGFHRVEIHYQRAL